MKILIREIKIPQPLSQATASNHSKVFTFTILLREGRTGEASESSNETMLCLQPLNKASLTSPMTFHFRVPFCYTFTSLSYDSKGYILRMKEWLW
jgi:hypothetical protein